MKLTAFAAALLAPIALVSAGAEEEEKPKSPAAGEAFEVAGHKFVAPGGWEKQTPSSSMRKAQFKIGGSEMVVFYFGKGQGGGTEANVSRWLGQFEEPREQLGAKSETADVGGGKAKVTTVSATGTFLSGPPFGKKVPKPGFALRGAIIECENGPIFMKLTGPEAQVGEQSKAFDKLVRSAFE